MLTIVIAIAIAAFIVFPYLAIAAWLANGLVNLDEE